MSGRDPGADQVRPIPQGHPAWDDDDVEHGEPYVVDTRRRPGAEPRLADRPRRDPAPGSGPRSASGSAPPPVDPRRTGPARPSRRHRVRRVVLVVVLLVLVWVAFMAWVPFNAWNHVTRVDNAPAGSRPADTSGYNYLLVGSDGRQGLTP